jgi:hypothetical protein
MFQARAAPSQGNESELRIVPTQKKVVISTAESKPGSLVDGPNRICTIFPRNCHGPTESSSRRIPNTLILGLEDRLDGPREIPPVGAPLKSEIAKQAVLFRR